MRDKPFGYPFIVRTSGLAVLLWAVSQTSSAAYVLQPLMIPGATQIQAFGINNQGQVAGALVADGRSSGFVMTHGLTTIITGPSGAIRASALDVSENGWVVGNFNLPAVDPVTGQPTITRDSGFIFDGSNYEVISLPGAIQTNLRGISPDGDLISGFVYFGDSASIGNAFVYRRSTREVTVISSIPGSQNVAQGINASGVVVGNQPRSATSSSSSGFTYQIAGGALSLYSFEGFASTNFRDINATHQLAGWLREAAPAPEAPTIVREVAFVGTPENFEVLRLSPTAVSTYAQGINDAGVVVGWGRESATTGDFASFIATPVPEPHAAVLGTLGLLALRWRLRLRTTPRRGHAGIA